VDRELCARVLEVEGPSGAALPFLGRAVHAWLLERLRSVAPALASGLHDEGGPRPYTTAYLLGRDGKGFVRATALTAEVADALERALDGLMGAEIVLDGRPFRVTAVRKDGHPWAGDASYRSLALGWLQRLPRTPPKKVALVFVTPTAFRRHGLTEPLPRPEAVFGGLVERWNAFAPQAFSPGLRRFVEEAVLLTRLEARTRAIPLAGAVHIGLVGKVEFSVTRPDPYWLTFLHILADFAFFAGVGAKTTMGMGLVRREPWPPST